MDTSILLELERAELAARERRLAAETQAEHMLAEAQAEAHMLGAGVARRIEHALEERRQQHRSETREEIEAIHAAMGRLGQDPASSPGGDDAVERAVELVVGEVLGDADRQGDDKAPGGEPPED